MANDQQHHRENQLFDGCVSRRLLLTGATGLLGEYLLRDLTVRGIGLAVLARGTRQYSGKQRIEGIMRRWERLMGRSLPRPVVLEGHLGDASLGLSVQAASWVREHCDGILHNAASLQFVAEQGPTGEPWRSNLAGTEHVLDFARRSRLDDYFQVSTAYVCGTRSGTILESQTDVGQSFGNDYEASKCAAEVVTSERGNDFKSLTTFRPGIITGDQLTGYTSTFHGLYTPMKVVASLLSMAPGDGPIPKQALLQILGLRGGEEKNFVPVDWVSESIATVVTRPQAYGQTYHLTADERTPCDLLADVMQEAFAEHWAKPDGDRPAASGARQPLDLTALLRSFRSQMEVYRAYWRNDPIFDRSNARRWLPELPPPVVDRACLKRLCRYALRNNFGWPRPQLRLPARWADELLRAGCQGQTSRNGESVNLRVLGEGGGDFHITGALQQRTAEATTVGSGIVVHGLAANPRGQLTMSSGTLDQLCRGQLPLRDAISLGKVVCQVHSDADSPPSASPGPRWLNDFERLLAGGVCAGDQRASALPRQSE